jgi:hypothetical protein
MSLNEGLNVDYELGRMRNEAAVTYFTIERRAVAMQRSRDGRIYQGRLWVTAL